MPGLIVVQDERGYVALDDSPQGYHPITNPELIQLMKFQMWLDFYERDTYERHLQ